MTTRNQRWGSRYGHSTSPATPSPTMADIEAIDWLVPEFELVTLECLRRADGQTLRRQPVLNRLFGQTQKDPVTGCWNYTGYRNEWGYGRTGVSTGEGFKYVAAHRLAWELTNRRPLLEGDCVCHKCDNPACVRPTHLFVGTNHDNVLDRTMKGRSYVFPAGDRNPSRVKHWAKRITEEQRDEIARLCRAGRPRKEVGVLFGIDTSTVCRIVNVSARGQ